MVLKIWDSKEPFSLASQEFVLLITQKKCYGRPFVTYEEKEVIHEMSNYFEK